MLISWFRFVDLPDAMLLVPLAFSVEASVFFFAIVLTEQLRRGAQYARTLRPGRSGPRCCARSSCCPPTTACSASRSRERRPDVFVPLYTVLLVLNLFFLLGALPRWFRGPARDVLSAGRPRRPCQELRNRPHGETIADR